jgi:hypothetical protein
MGIVTNNYELVNAMKAYQVVLPVGQYPRMQPLAHMAAHNTKTNHSQGKAASISTVLAHTTGLVVANKDATLVPTKQRVETGITE